MFSYLARSYAHYAKLLKLRAARTILCPGSQFRLLLVVGQKGSPCPSVLASRDAHDGMDEDG